MSFAIDVLRVPHGQVLAGGQRRTRVFALMLLTSAVVHLLVILMMGPALRRADAPAPPPLDVAIVRTPVPEPVTQPPRVQPQRPREAPRAPARAQPAEALRKAVPAAPTEQRQVLALPETTAPSTATFTVPQASVEPAPAAAEQKGAAPAPAAPTREVASSPAIFNAAYLRNAPPRYPLIARRNGVEGTVRLKVFVSREGKPAQVQLEQSSGSAALDSAALDAVKTWQFVPARRGQEAIESWVLVPVVFRLEGGS